MEVSDGKNCHHSSCPESGRDVVTSDDIWLLVGQKGEDRNPSGENVGERVHLYDTGHQSSLVKGTQKKKKRIQN
jgi:hypothetical protein